MLFHGRPIVTQDAVDDAGPDVAVRHDHVLAQQAFFDRPDALESPLRALVAEIGFELHSLISQHFKSVPQKQELALGIDAGALIGRRIPRAADLQGAVLRLNVEVARAADGPYGFWTDHGESEIRSHV